MNFYGFFYNIFIEFQNKNEININISLRFFKLKKNVLYVKECLMFVYLLLKHEVLR